MEVVDRDLTQRWKDRRDVYRVRGEAFYPGDYGVELITGDKMAREFVVKHHYSGSYPAARCRVGLFRRPAGWFGPVLVGVAVFSVPMSEHVIPKWLKVAPKLGVELGRFVLEEDVPFNGETWFLRRAVEAMREELKDVEGIVSFSDPVPRRNGAGVVVMPGHVGTIYQAKNAIYRGRTNPVLHYQGESGQFASPRILSKIRTEQQGWAYASRELISLGVAPREPGERPGAWRTNASRSGSDEGLCGEVTSLRGAKALPSTCQRQTGAGRSRRPPARRTRR